MTRNRRINFILALVTVACLSTVLAAAENPSPLRVDVIDGDGASDDRLLVRCARGQHVIEIETHRAGLRPGVLRDAELGTTPFELDLVIRDAGGIFFAVVGGHELGLPAWREELSREGNPDGRTESFALAAAALPAIASNPRLASLRDETELIRQAGLILSRENGMIPTELVRRGCNATAPYVHSVHMGAKPFFVSGMAEHSAPAICSWYATATGWTKVFQAFFMNHGTDVRDMPIIWSRYYYNRTNMYPALWYCATSYGFFSGQHVCNDDSLVEWYGVVMNGPPSGATCADSTLRRYAPR